MGKNASRVQTILDYLRYEELTSKSATTQKDVNKLTKETKKGRWDRIKKEIGLFFSLMNRETGIRPYHFFKFEIGYIQFISFMG